MARRFWKTVAPLLVLITALMGVFVFLCVGCGSDNANEGEKPSKPVTRGKYVVFDDGEGQTYKVSCHLGSRPYAVYYDFDLSKTYLFSYKIYYSDNDEFTGESGNWIDAPGEFNSPQSFKVHAFIPGVYPISVYTKLSNGSLECADLAVIVKSDEMITLDVSFDPCGAIDYIPNEKYVYKYDGNEHYPRMLVSYSDWMKIDLYNNGRFSKIETIDSKEPLRGTLKSVGTYKVTYKADYSTYLTEHFNALFNPIVQEIIVEIVE